MKKRQYGFSAVEGLLILIIVGLLVFVGWYVWDSNNKTKETLTNTDKSSSVSTKSVAKTQTQATDKELITKAVTQDCEAAEGSKPSEVNVYKQEGNYAAVTLACSYPQDGSNPTSRLYLKKVSGDWTIVVRGGGAPTTSEDLKPYGFPSDFLD